MITAFPKSACLSFAVLALCSRGAADESLAGSACRSVHLSYPEFEAVAFANTVIIDQSAPGSYFMVCGWSKGYFGLQELADGKKLILFSVWDLGEQNDFGAVEERERVKLVFRDPDVRVGRFGGEGTGGQSFFDFDWKLGEPYQLAVAAASEEGRSTYAGFLFDPAAKRWRKLVAFSTPSDGELLRSCYSFVEDFRRNRVSATQPRVARFGDGWMRAAAGDPAWKPLLKARFTADQNPVVNINAGLKSPHFFLATGGDVSNDDAKLNSVIEREASPEDRPADLP
jgi:hypothetical protein